MPKVTRSISSWLVGLVMCASVAGCNSAGIRASDPITGEGGSGSGQKGGNRGNLGQGGSGTIIMVPDASAPPADTSPPPSACAEEAHSAEAVPLDLMLLVDVSGSMNERVSAGPADKWGLTKGALTAFVQDPRSATLGVGLQFFPEQMTCQTAADCGGGQFSECRGATKCANAQGMLDPRDVLGVSCEASVIPADACSRGYSCRNLGICINSGAECFNIGQSCADGNMCQAVPKRCAGSAAECAAKAYEAPAVPIGVLPGNQMKLLRALGAKLPDGGTPMRPAVDGALKQLKQHLAKNPGHKAALLLATDGLPSGCSPEESTSIVLPPMGAPPPMVDGIGAVADLVGAANRTAPSVSTYVIGVSSLSQPQGLSQLNQVAMAGGTNQAFVLAANGDLSKRLQEALDTIRGAALSCDFKIPPPKTGMLDFGKVNVRYTPTVGAREDIGYVKSLASCDPARGGWYYDVEPSAGTPTRVLVCPTTCEKFKKDGSAKVDLVFGCATRAVD